MMMRAFRSRTAPPTKPPLFDVATDDNNGDGKVDFTEFVEAAFQNPDLLLPIAFR